MLTVIVMTHHNRYNIKERIFMGLAWIPKTTVPATLAGIIFTQAKIKGYDEY